MPTEHRESGMYAAKLRPGIKEGNPDTGPWSFRRGGLIRDTQTMKELTDRIMREADEIISKRVTNFLQPS